MNEMNGWFGILLFGSVLLLGGPALQILPAQAGCPLYEPDCEDQEECPPDDPNCQ